MFALVLLGMSILIGVISSLPLTDTHLFDSLSDLYYICTPLRLPGEKGWGFSLLILLLNWAAVIVIVICTAISFKYGQKYQRDYSLDRTKPSRGQQHLAIKIGITLTISAISWIIMLLILCINYFSVGSVIDRYAVQWILGYLLSVVILLQPVTLFLVSMVTKRKWYGAWITRLSLKKSPLYKNLPNKLDTVQKMESEQQVGSVFSRLRYHVMFCLLLF